MKNKDRFQYYFNLRGGSPNSSLPEAWKSRRNFSDLIDRYRESVEAVKGQVIHLESKANIYRSLEALFKAHNIQSIVMSEEEVLSPIPKMFGNRHTFHRLKNYSKNRESWRAVCAAADAGITSAEALLAETGTLILSSGSGKSRLVSLLPPVHIVIAPEGHFTMDIFTWLQSLSGSWPSNRVLISGPSKTADIEQTMSVGVHGPKKLIVLIYPNE